jgi:thiamine biosynthesis lipoprotein
MIAAALLAAALAARMEFRELHMGVEVRIVIHAEDADRARAAARAAFDRIRDWDDALSDWRESTPARLLPSSAGGCVQVSGRLAHALEISRRLASDTEGGFDAGLGSLTALWREARRTRTLPSNAQIERARACAGATAWAWDPADGRFTALRDGVRMDFGAVGQGLAADDALASLRASGHGSALVDVSGDIAIGSPPPGESGWRVRVTAGQVGQPDEELLLHDCGISTSGDQVQRLRVADMPIGHLLDPATGRPLPKMRQATVIADCATIADAVATALCVLPPVQAQRVAERRARAARIDRLPHDGGVITTGGWRSITRSSCDPAGEPEGSAAQRPSPAQPASGPPGSPTRPST